MNKRGVLGLNTTTSFVLGILSLAIVGFAVVLLLGNLASQTGSGFTETVTVSVVNGTFTLVDVQNTSTDLSTYIGEGASLSSVTLTNESNPTTVDANNYTISGVEFQNAAGMVAGWNTSKVNVSATVSFTISRGADISRNTTSGIANFFTNAGSWFSLLAIVIIILIIAVVIVAVNRFGGGTGGFKESSGNEGL